MHNRQSGAAYVPMMFFLILLLMFLGALGFAYVTHTKNGELTTQVNEAQAEAQRTSIRNQQAEQARIHKLLDAELERLRKLWKGAMPGSLGPPPQ